MRTMCGVPPRTYCDGSTALSGKNTRNVTSGPLTLAPNSSYMRVRYNLCQLDLAHQYLISVGSPHDSSGTDRDRGTGRQAGTAVAGTRIRPLGRGRGRETLGALVHVRPASRRDTRVHRGGA